MIMKSVLESVQEKSAYVDRLIKIRDLQIEFRKHVYNTFDVENGHELRTKYNIAITQTDHQDFFHLVMGNIECPIGITISTFTNSANEHSCSCRIAALVPGSIERIKYNPNEIQEMYDDDNTMLQLSTIHDTKELVKFMNKVQNIETFISRILEIRASYGFLTIF